MAYQVEQQAPLSIGIHRALQHLIQDIQVLLHNESLTLDERVHNARTGFKRCRAMLRFLRNRLTYDDYTRENLCFRDLGRLLAESRDSYILVESIDYLVEKYADRVSADSVADARKQLLARYQHELSKFVNDGYLYKIYDGLQWALERIANWQVAGTDLAFINSMGRVYRNAQLNMQLAISNKDDLLMHEWRKDVKYLWYQIEMLTSADPAELSELAESFHRLSGYLGLDHDLYELKNALAELPECPENYELLIKVMALEKARLQQLAERESENLFRGPMEAFVNNIYQFWSGEKV